MNPRFFTFCFLLLLRWQSTVISAKTVLVTGGAGFVGSHVADVLLERGDTVVVVDEINHYYNPSVKRSNLKLLQERHPRSRIHIYETDICNVVTMEQIFDTFRFDAICHLAARAGVRPSIEDPYVYVHSNIQGTLTLFELARRYSIPNFVFASSSSVYGGSLSTLFSEGDQVDFPISPYAASKKSCELFGHVYSHQYGLNITALRFFTVYGPRGRPDMAPFKFIDRVSRGIAIQQFGDGSSSRDYTYIDDIVNGVVACIDTPARYKLLNLGKGSGTKLLEFVRLVEKYVGKNAQIEQLPDQPGDVPRTCANVTEAYRHIHYNATIPFELGIQKTVAWYQEAYPLKRRQSRQLQAISDNKIVVPSRRQLATRSFPVTPHTSPKLVLVTGGNGFVGQHVVKSLLDRGDLVVVVDLHLHNLDNFVDKRLLLHRGDITNQSLMESVFASSQPEWIIHLAGRTEDSFKNPVEYVKHNVEGTLRLLDLSKSVKNFVLASSSAVYGKGHALWKVTDRVDTPITPFAASKKTAELIAYTYHHLYKIPVNVLRFFNVYGPHHQSHSESFQIVDRILSNNFTGSVTFSQSDFVYIDDAVQGILQALDRPYGYEIFNVGSGEDNSIEFVRAVSQGAGAMDDTRNEKFFYNASVHSRSDIENSRRLLDYRPKTSLRNGVSSTIEWQKNHSFGRLPSGRNGAMDMLPARISNLFSCLQWILVALILLARFQSKIPRGGSNKQMTDSST